MDKEQELEVVFRLAHVTYLPVISQITGGDFRQEMLRRVYTAPDGTQTVLVDAQNYEEKYKSKGVKIVDLPTDFRTARGRQCNEGGVMHAPVVPISLEDFKQGFSPRAQVEIIMEGDGDRKWWKETKELVRSNRCHVAGF